MKHLFDEIHDALRESMLWNRARSAMDAGSYCENASPEYILATRIMKAYHELADSLVQWEREYQELPKAFKRTGED